MKKILTLLTFSCIASSAMALPSFIASSHKNDEIFIKDANANTVWQYKIAHPQDVCVLEDGNILVAWERGVSIISKDKKVLWQYDVSAPAEVPVAQPIEDGKILVGIVGDCRLVEFKDGKITKTIKLHTPVKKAHEQIRYSRKTKDNTYLITFASEGFVRELDNNGNVIYEYPKMTFPTNAVRLKNGNTLISDVGIVREYDKDKKVVWTLEPKDVPEINFSAITQVQRLPNGNTVLTNWDAKTKDGKIGAHIFEVTPDKKVVWTYSDPEFGQIAQCQILTDKLLPLKDVQK